MPSVLSRRASACASTASLLIGTGVCSAQDEVLYALTDYVFPQLVTYDAGSLAFLSAVPVTGHEALFGGLAVEDGGRLFSIDGYNDSNSDRTFSIDRATGTGTVVGATSFNWNFRMVAVHPVTNTLYGATDNTLVTINQGTGQATVVAPITGPTLDQLTAIVIDASGTCWGTDIGDTGLFTISLATGVATHVGNLRPGLNIDWFDDLAFRSDGTMFGSLALGGGLFEVNTAGLSMQQVGFGFYRGLAFYGSSGGCDCVCDYDTSTGQGVCDFFDFITFQDLFATGDDCGCELDTSTGPGVCDFFDFISFQDLFSVGC